MQRIVVTLALVAGCVPTVGDDPVEPEPAVVVAHCSDAELASELGALGSVTKIQESACGPYVQVPARCFEVSFRQPISPTSTTTFEQHVYLTHRGCDRPVVIADWGYSNDLFFDDELATLFRANTLWLEHRYQGESVPSSADWNWNALTIENGAADTHRVIEAFKHVYGGHWVSTGASKGGITAVYHHYFWPADLDGTIPYVAPASRARVDGSYQAYINAHMTSACAKQVRDTQLAAVTTRHNAMITRLTPIAGAGNEEAYLQSIAGSLDWSFWQYFGNTSCSAVPTTATSDDNFFAFLKQASQIPQRLPGTDVRSDGALSYEWLTEQGFADQLSPTVATYVTDPSARMSMEAQFAALYPEALLPAFNGKVTSDVRTWAKGTAENMLLIYGELDPWSGGALDAPTKSTSARYFVPGANHGAQIAGLEQTNRSAALAHAARMFGESPDLGALPRAITASQNRDKILARAFARNQVLDTPY